MIEANFEVHFLQSDDPRHDLRIMSTDPLVYYEFNTPVGFLSTHTIVRAAGLAQPSPSFSAQLTIGRVVATR
jgi:hypothetical protein